MTVVVDDEDAVVVVGSHLLALMDDYNTFVAVVVEEFVAGAALHQIDAPFVVVVGVGVEPVVAVVLVVEIVGLVELVVGDDEIDAVAVVAEA